MQHYDEHILELYVLQSDFVEQNRGEIRDHLSLCHGCADLVARMTECYVAAEKEMGRPADRELRPMRALARFRQEPELLQGMEHGTVPYRPRSGDRKSVV
jgi:hypothetical protein